MEQVQLYNGSCYDIIPALKDASIDLIVTDPPYRLDPHKGTGVYGNNVVCLDELEKLESVSFEPKSFLDLLKPKLKKFYGYFFCNKFLVKEYLEWADDSKMKFDIFTLLKSNPLPAWGGHHLNDTEYCIMIRESGAYFDRKLELDDYRKSFTQKCIKRIHPAEKPVEFLEKFIKVSCPKDGTVLDPFMGSGSTGVAACALGRRFIGIEKSRDYFCLAEKRIREIDHPSQLCFDFGDGKQPASSAS